MPHLATSLSVAGIALLLVSGPAIRTPDLSVNDSRAHLGQRFRGETLRTISGIRFRQSSVSGKWVVVDMVASWCDACVRDLPSELADAKTGGSNVLFLVVDEREQISAVTRLAKRFGMGENVWLDRVDNTLTNQGDVTRRRRFMYYGSGGPLGCLAEAAGVTMLPSELLVDPTGTIRAIWHGRSLQVHPMISAMRRLGLITSKPH